MSELNDDMWEQIELNNYGKGKLVHIVNEQAELIRSLYEQLDSAHREGWEQGKRECVEKIDSEICDCCWGGEAQEASDHLCETIAAMEYKGESK